MSNHIENLKISNFKCFKELEVSNIGRVNLIGGKNNVGKTAFLEVVELFSSSDKPFDLISVIYKIVKRRQSLNQFNQPIGIELDFVYDKTKELEVSSLSKVCKLKFETVSIKEINNALPTEAIQAFLNKEFAQIQLEHIGHITSPIHNYTLFISSSKIQEQDIAVYFGSLTELSLESFLNNSLSLFDENILELKTIPTKDGIVLKLKLKNNKSLVLLSSLGEGINRYIAILCAIWASKDSVLLIDEIENGIHYTNYKKLWQIIFQASVDANCQIFITTHSKECISAFNEVQLDNKYDACNAQYFEFYRHLKKDLIVASNVEKEQLHYSLTHDGRVRGE